MELDGAISRHRDQMQEDAAEPEADEKSVHGISFQRCRYGASYLFISRTMSCRSNCGPPSGDCAVAQAERSKASAMPPVAKSFFIVSFLSKTGRDGSVCGVAVQVFNIPARSLTALRDTASDLEPFTKIACNIGRVRGWWRRRFPTKRGRSTTL